MATVVINTKNSLSTNSIQTVDQGIINVNDIKPTVVIDIKNDLYTNSIETLDYGIIKINDTRPIATIEETVPFRIKLTNITIPGYSANNVPGIGIQVIGFSNYIL